MRLVIAILVAFCFLAVFPPAARSVSPRDILANRESVMPQAGTNGGIPLRDISLTILYDNNPGREGLTAGWGFSCLVRGTERSILFDTGGNGAILLNNMRQLGIAPQAADVVVLSHVHGDHVGGLGHFLHENPHVEVWLPDSFPKKFQQAIKDRNAGVRAVAAPERICRHVYTTGPLGALPKEQSLVIDTDGGLIVVTGCAHPGIVAIVKKAGSLLDDGVLLALGGFHLSGESAREMKNIISGLQQLGVRKLAPCHCTGTAAKEFFQQTWRENYLEVGVGRVISGKDLY
jgi:7,8-dihydropterin-6-yl-methyl-4-(beta-D-ribofuranosyl)aminobenzene 5'-phosphate synthase